MEWQECPNQCQNKASFDGRSHVGRQQEKIGEDRKNTLQTLEKKPLPISSAVKFSQNSSLRTAVRSFCQRSTWQYLSDDSPYRVGLVGSEDTSTSHILEMSAGKRNSHRHSLSYGLGPDRYIGFPILSADIGLLQIYWYQCIIYSPIWANIKTVFKVGKNAWTTNLKCNDHIFSRI